jgi:hypothetical protein
VHVGSGRRSARRPPWHAVVATFLRNLRNAGRRGQHRCAQGADLLLRADLQSALGDVSDDLGPQAAAGAS